VSRKPTEEGWFWEWRTFGQIPEPIAARVAAYELRGEPAMENEDLYLISTLTDQNVKLRGSGGQLKLKPLLVRLDGGFELYEETERLVFPMPAPPDAIRMAAGLLGIAVETAAPLGLDALLDRLAAGAPEVTAVRVRKLRTQYAAGDGWIELAELEFPGARVRSLGIQSRRLELTRALRDEVDPDRVLEPLGYVAACRMFDHG
jgi:hypothetical protein